MESPAPMVTLVPSVLPGEFSADLVHEPLWRQLGADHCRVAVVGLLSLQALAWRWMRDGGVSSGQGDAQPLDHILPGADTLLSHWVEASATEPDAVITHMLSPRRWVYFWRVDGHLGVLVQMHFLTGRSSAHEFDTAGVRIVTEHWLASDLRALEPGTPVQAWDRNERRMRPPMPRTLWVALLSLLGCGLFGLWLAVAGASAAADAATAHQRERARLSALANGGMQGHLGLALAGNDYGQVQEVLSMHKTLEHFAAAAVTNARGQVVAHAGFSPALRVGMALPADLRSRTQALPLTAGNTPFGEVFMLSGPDGQTRDSGQQALWWRLAGTLCAAAAALGVLALWRQQYGARR